VRDRATPLRGHAADAAGLSLKRGTAAADLVDMRSSPSRSSLALWALVGAAAVLCVFGAVLAAGVLRAGEPEARLPSGPFGTSQDIPVSFGAFAVERVSKLDGLTGKDLAGAVHGISGLVEAGKVKVQANVNLTNLTQQPVAYSPAQFELLVGSEDARPRRLAGATIRQGELQPSASIDAELSFVAPAGGKRLWLRFRDPGQARPVLVDLGKTGKRTDPAVFDRFFDHH
jgi:hypothetical protein